LPHPSASQDQDNLAVGLWLDSACAGVTIFVLHQIFRASLAFLEGSPSLGIVKKYYYTNFVLKTQLETIYLIIINALSYKHTVTNEITQLSEDN
jgi:hypothetical protein